MGVSGSSVRRRVKFSKIECKEREGEEGKAFVQADTSPLCRRLAGVETVAVQVSFNLTEMGVLHVKGMGYSLGSSDGDGGFRAVGPSSGEIQQNRV